MEEDALTDELFDLGAGVVGYAETREGRHVSPPTGGALLLDDCPGCHH